LEINIFWRHFLLNENDVFWSKQRRFLNCSLKKKERRSPKWCRFERQCSSSSSPRCAAGEEEGF